MELSDYLRIIRRRWIVIVASVLIATGAAALYSFTATPMYQSQTRVFVSTTDADTTSTAYQGGQYATQRVTSYADIATGRELAQRVIDQLGLPMTPPELIGQISASVVTNTVIVAINVTEADPAEAQRIAAAVAEQLQQFVTELETPPGQTTPLIKATVIDPASLPTSPVSPNKVRNLALGLAVGLLLGFALALLRETLDNTVKGAADIAEFTDTPVLGGILFDKDAAKQPLISQLGSHDPRVEAFRILRTNLQFVDVDRSKKVFVVTSAVPGEGKTTSASNIALALHGAGQRTLLIDGDMRRPRLEEYFNLEPAVGLTTVLVGRLGLKDAVQVHQDSGLEVLTCGNVPPNPAELLQSHAMEQLLGEVRSEYDVVIIDAPPLLPVTDAALIASQVDGAVLVVRQGRTTREQVRHCLERLEAVGARALGISLNMVPARRRSGYGYGYGYGYAPTAARPEALAEEVRPPSVG